MTTQRPRTNLGGSRRGRDGGCPVATGMSDLGGWLLDAGRGSDPALVDAHGTLSRDELRSAVRDEARESFATGTGPVRLDEDNGREWVVRYLAALHAGRQVRLG